MVVATPDMILHGVSDDGKGGMSGGPLLRLDERESISRGLSRNLSARKIATELGRSHSTVSREINDNGGPEGYRAVEAQQRAEELRARPKERKLVTDLPK
jgi:IS30 family transposase